MAHHQRVSTATVISPAEALEVDMAEFTEMDSERTERVVHHMAERSPTEGAEENNREKEPITPTSSSKGHHRRRFSEGDLIVPNEPGEPDEETQTGDTVKFTFPEHIARKIAILQQEPTARRSFWSRMVDTRSSHHSQSTYHSRHVSHESFAHMTRDPYHDFDEQHDQQVVFEVSPGEGVASNKTDFKIPTLHECQRQLRNEDMEKFRRASQTPRKLLERTWFDFIAAFYIYFVNTVGIESFFVLANAVLVTVIFCLLFEDVAVKLDFSFLAFAIVFPLTFLIGSTFGRRDLALQRLADFKACILSTCLTTLSVDWPPLGDSSSPSGGRLDLPLDFNQQVVRDCRELVFLAYRYLSMPSVGHARFLVFKSKKLKTKKIHAAQNEILKQFNHVMVDFFQHTEEMRRAGFSSGEASRLHQYHQYLQQRFEQMRILKYYRTPQATRSFGRVYIFLLPWLTGPYYAWVKEESHLAIAVALSGFTYLILLGLLNTQQGLEDPFLPDFTSWTPGIDTVKIDYEFAVVLQGVDQYYAQSELLRLWELKERQQQKRSTSENVGA